MEHEINQSYLRYILRVLHLGGNLGHFLTTCPLYKRYPMPT